CRRASRNSAEGRNTEAAEGFLLSRIAVMAVARRRVEHRSIVIRWRFDQICQAQAPSAESGAGDWPDNCDLMRTRLNVRANLSIGQHRSAPPYARARTCCRCPALTHSRAPAAPATAVRREFLGSLSQEC